MVKFVSNSLNLLPGALCAWSLDWLENHQSLLVTNFLRRINQWSTEHRWLKHFSFLPPASFFDSTLSSLKKVPVTAILNLLCCPIIDNNFREWERKMVMFESLLSHLTGSFSEHNYLCGCQKHDTGSFCNINPVFFLNWQNSLPWRG